MNGDYHIDLQLLILFIACSVIFKAPPTKHFCFSAGGGYSIRGLLWAALWDAAGEVSHSLALPWTQAKTDSRLKLPLSHVGIFLCHFITPTHFCSTTGTVSAYFHGCFLCRELLIDSSVKGQCATLLRFSCCKLGNKFFFSTAFIIIIIMSRCQHAYFWPLSPLLPIVHRFLAGLPGYIQYRHRAAVCMFELDVLPLLVPVKGSIGVHHLRAHCFFSSSVPHVWFV